MEKKHTTKQTQKTSICTYGAVTFLQWILFFPSIVCISLVLTSGSQQPAQSSKDKCIENKDRILMHFCINWKRIKRRWGTSSFLLISESSFGCSFHALNCVANQKKKIRKIFHGKMFRLQLKRKNTKCQNVYRFCPENVKYAGLKSLQKSNRNRIIWSIHDIL